MIDPDAPIPYVITDKGRADLRAAELEERIAMCDHRWTAHAGILVCSECGMDRKLTRGGSIPSYLSPRERNTR